jgi:hypothetical protein
MSPRADIKERCCRVSCFLMLLELLPVSSFVLHPAEHYAHYGNALRSYDRKDRTS